MQVLIIIYKNILNKVIIDNLIDFISNLYWFILNIREYYLILKKIF